MFLMLSLTISFIARNCNRIFAEVIYVCCNSVHFYCKKYIFSLFNHSKSLYHKYLYFIRKPEPFLADFYKNGSLRFYVKERICTPGYFIIESQNPHLLFYHPSQYFCRKSASSENRARILQRKVQNPPQRSSVFQGGISDLRLSHRLQCFQRQTFAPSSRSFQRILRFLQAFLCRRCRKQ